MSNLNTVVEQVLKSYQQQMQSGELIIRCEQLPHIEGDDAAFQKVFENIFDLIISGSSAEKKQFLHIVCKRAERPVDLKADAAEWKDYKIEFKTNIKCQIDKDGEAKDRLQECEQMLSKSNGALQLYCISGEGCLISMVLKGKMM